MAYNFNFNFDGIIKFPVAFWKGLGSWIVNTIRKEAGQGIFQTDEAHKKTYSKAYAELKENDFRPKQINASKSGNTSNKKADRLKQYQGVSIASRNTSFVDMTATGRTMRGLAVKEAFSEGVTVAFKPEDAMKIIGNQRPGLNRRLVGLHKRNREKVRDMVITQIQTALVKQVVGKTTININI